jgi:hypothetical protein
MVLGQLRGPSLETGTPPRWHHRSGNIVAPVGLEVCDGGHGLGVMKKGGSLPRWSKPLALSARVCIAPYRCVGILGSLRLLL